MFNPINHKNLSKKKKIILLGQKKMEEFVLFCVRSPILDTSLLFISVGV